MPDSSYQVIARRWRPQQFSELVGQDHVVKTLGNAIDLGRIAHAYLFVGPRGTGKTTSARLFAKSLNWEDGPSLDVPEDSEIGKAIMEGRCLDVIEIDGASNNSVDQVRDLRDECQYAPAQCRFKIYAKMISNHILIVEDPGKVNSPLPEMKLTKLKSSPELSKAKLLALRSPCL